MVNETIGVNQRAKEYNRDEHRKVWEKHHGKIPKDHVIHHKNGNKKDNMIENLECLDRINHAKKHLLPGRKRLKYLSGAVKVIRCTE